MKTFFWFSTVTREEGYHVNTAKNAEEALNTLTAKFLSYCDN